jgi:hypothetical protein
MFKHYMVLGLEPNATNAQVKARFKKLSMKHHPDRGGDTEQFKIINEAYDAIINGGKPSPSADKNQEAINLIIQLFNDCINDCHGKPPHQIDLLAMAKKKISNALDDVRTKRTSLKRSLGVYKKLSGRMKTKPDCVNAFEMLVNSKQAEIEHNINESAIALAQLNLVGEMLENYDFDFEQTQGEVQQGYVTWNNQFSV